VRISSTTLFSSSSLCVEMMGCGGGGGAGVDSGCIGRRESSFSYRGVRSTVVFDKERNRLISSRVCRFRSFDSRI